MLFNYVLISISLNYYKLNKNGEINEDYIYACTRKL